MSSAKYTVALGPPQAEFTPEGGVMAKSIFISNILPDEARALIPREVAVDYNSGQTGLSKAELIARLRGKDGLICHIISAIDEEVLAAAPTVKVVANVAVGYNNIDVAAARTSSSIALMMWQMSPS